MTWEEIDKEFDRVSAFMKIYVQLLEKKILIGGFNMPEYSNFDRLNKPLSKNSFDYVDNQGNFIWKKNDYTKDGLEGLKILRLRLKSDFDYNTKTVFKKQYNYWLGFKYYI